MPCGILVWNSWVERMWSRSSRVKKTFLARKFHLKDILFSEKKLRENAYYWNNCRHFALYFNKVQKNVKKLLRKHFYIEEKVIEKFHFHCKCSFCSLSLFLVLLFIALGLFIMLILFTHSFSLIRYFVHFVHGVYLGFILFIELIYFI